MAGIEIKAVYADMLKCAEILDNIGADVKLAYTDIDDFLNKKMVFNGKQIYANWQVMHVLYLKKSLKLL